MIKLGASLRLFTHRHWQQLRLPLGLLLLSGCASAQHVAQEHQQAVAMQTKCERDAQAAELTLAKQEVRLLLLRTRLDAQAAELSTAVEQLEGERKRRTRLEAPADKPAAVSANRSTADPKPPRDLLRRQTASLESAVRATRDSVARQTQLLQQTKTSVRNLEQALADRDRTITDLRQRLTAAQRKPSPNPALNDGKMHVILPDEPVKALIRAIF